MTARAGPRASAARVAAQAKINLRLRILAREASGYHQLETLFLRLALADDVLVRATDGARSLDVAGEVDARQLGAAERNLAWRAADAYAAATGWPAGFAIELDEAHPRRRRARRRQRRCRRRAARARRDGADADRRAARCSRSRRGSAPTSRSSRRRAPYALAWGRGERMLALRAPRRARGAARAAALRASTRRRRTAGSPPRATRARRAADATGVLDADALGDWTTIARARDERLRARRRGAPSDDRRACSTRLRAARVRAGDDERLRLDACSACCRARRRGLPRFDGTLGGPAPRVLLTRPPSPSRRSFRWRERARDHALDALERELPARPDRARLPAPPPSSNGRTRHFGSGIVVRIHAGECGGRSV